MLTQYGRLSSCLFANLPHLLAVVHAEAVAGPSAVLPRQHLTDLRHTQGWGSTQGPCAPATGAFTSCEGIWVVLGH